MCKNEELPPSTIRADSTDYSQTTEDSAVDFDNQDWPSQSASARKEFSKNGSSSTKGQRKVQVAVSVGGGLALGVAITAFALVFPFILAPEAAKKTYDWAFYEYQDGISHFDNTIWTYGTDYALATITGLVALSILAFSRNGVSETLCKWSAGLLFGYSASTLAGAYCHQNFLTLEDRNTVLFRLLWTICVGTVSSASGFMGSSGTEVLRKFRQQPNCNPVLHRIPLVPESLWWSMAFLVTAVTAYGGMSFQRPACDIFIAGITQSPPTFYLMILFSAIKHPKVQLHARIFGVVGFILNAPLLPMYPLLIQYTDWTLASVNTLLHTCLCIAWSLQGYSLRHMIKALVETKDEERANTKIC